MASYTGNLDLYKVDPTVDGDDTFNIDLLLNNNWDKIDQFFNSLDSGTVKEEASSVVDINNALNSGFYVAENPSNAPVNNELYLILVIANEGRVVQYAFTLGTKEIYFRFYTGSSWSNWNLVLTEADGIKKVNASSKPTINDYDHEVGTLWIYDKNIYILVDNTVDDAVWESVINDEKIKRVREYGLRWNKTTDTYTRLGDAQGLEVQGAGTTGEHLSDFDDIYPYSEMKRCNLSDNGVVNAYYGDPDFATDGSNGQLMVEMHKHYYKTDHYTNGSGEEVFEFWIADGKKAGYEIEPNFYRDGSVKDKIYIGAVEGNVSGGKMRSIFSVQPTTEYTIGQFRGYAEARGAGWTQRDLLVTSLIQRLMIIEYGTFNLQSALSEGITNLDSGTGNHSQNTGYTDSLGNHSGEVIKSALDNGATGASETYPFSYRGIENPYGNTWEFADGFIIKDDGYYFEDDHNNFNDTGSGYNHINVSPLTDSDGYVDNLQYLSDFEFAFIPKSTGGTSSTHITDYHWSHDAGEVNIARVGADWHYGLRAGAFDWSLHSVASASHRDISARLLYIPQE
jgi:hypothetical protein